jgi:hypothetical protein
MIRLDSRGCAIVLVWLSALACPVAALADECLQQKALPDGCVQTGGMIGCTPIAQLDGPYRINLSPDDETVYVPTFFTDTLIVLDRDTADGTLTQLAGLNGCLSDTGSGGLCTDVRNFNGVANVAITDNGQTAYVGTYPGLSIFDRNTGTGALTQRAGAAGCINAAGADSCATANQIHGVSHVALSPGPSHSNLYAATYGSNGILVFDRDAMTGNLTQKPGAAGCINETGAGGCTDGRGLLNAIHLVVSPDGKSVYVIGLDDSSIAVFDRDTGTGALTQKAGLAGCFTSDGNGGECTTESDIVLVSSADISPDGKNLYVVAGYTGSSIALTVFDRDTTTGALTRKPGLAGCISSNGSGGTCVDGRGMTSPRGVAVSSDGLAVFVAVEDSDGVAVFQRDPVDGTLTQPPGTAGCANDNPTDGCAQAVGMIDSLGLATSDDGASVYVGGHGTDSVAIFDRVACPPTTTTTTVTTTTTTDTTTTTSTTTTTAPTSTTTTSTTLSPTTTTTLPEQAEACGEAPLALCRDQAGLARLRMRSIGTPVSPTVEFVWKLGEMTAVDALGDPTASTAYSLCVYAAGSRVLDLTVPPGPRWKAGTRRRYRYYDGTGSAAGVRKLVLQAGSTGEAKVRVRARGVNVDFPALPLAAPLRVQLVGDDGGGLECWEAEFASLGTNTNIKVEAEQ